MLSERERFLCRILLATIARTDGDACFVCSSGCATLLELGSVSCTLGEMLDVPIMAGTDSEWSLCWIAVGSRPFDNPCWSEVFLFSNEKLGSGCCIVISVS